MKMKFCKRFTPEDPTQPRFVAHFAAFLTRARYGATGESMALPRLRRWAWGVGAYLVVLGVLPPRSAEAQTTTTGTTTTTTSNCPNLSFNLGSTVPRFFPGADTAANMYPFRPAQLDPNGINYQDCIDNINLQFTLLIGGLPCTDTIQVWAGPSSTDCTQSTSRMSSDGDAQCWEVTPDGLFQMATTSTENIRAQDIVSHLSDSAITVDTYTPAKPSACQSQTFPGTVQLNITFMAMNPDGVDVDASISYPLDGDLVGPYPPTGVSAGIGENVIIVTWTPAIDSTTQGFNVYCQPLGAVVPNTGTVVPEASLVCPNTGTTATTDATTTTTTAPDAAGCFYVNEFDSGSGVAGAEACMSPGDVLKNVWSTTPTGIIDEAGLEQVTDAGQTDGEVAIGAIGISNIPGQYLCGSVSGNLTSSLNVTNLSFDGSPAIMDGVEYAVTVAAFDEIGNVGIIGNLSCVTPSPVIDFWTAYTKAGGLAGGGFCALEGVGMPVSSSLLGIGMGAALVGFTRRRRRR